ncbi:MAG TPA: hypothetical protein VFN03_11550, partial [Trueperaceae bacterium]|nr:hypothetical protein [Trueperaceae bacterium]
MMDSQPELAALLRVADERERLEGLLAYAARMPGGSHGLAAAEHAIELASAAGSAESHLCALAAATKAALSCMELES